MLTFNFEINNIMETIINQLKQLETISKYLEPTREDRADIREQIVSYTEKFLNELDELKVYGNKAKLLPESFDIEDEATNINQLLTGFNDCIDSVAINPASGGYLGYIPGGGLYVSALGDYMADISNKFSGLLFASPGAVRLENLLIKWLNKLIGFPEETAVGNLTSGGSIANLISVVTAREAFKLKANEYANHVIYLSEHAHHSVGKAFRIAGLSDCIKRFVPLDENYRMNSDKLQQFVEEDLQNGLSPWIVIASAGTTDVGAVDPLEDIAKICKQHKIWFHVDAAYGGFFLLTEQGKEKLKGIEEADSVVMDPHKGLFLPYGLGAVLIKDKVSMIKAHSFEASYLPISADFEETSPAQVSPELTKPFRAVRMWLPLKVHGLAPFKAALEEKILLARYFYDKIKKAGFEVGPYPDLSIVTFRFVPKTGNVDLFNEKLVKEVQQDGRIYLSSTRIDNKFVIRMAILSFRTHLKIIDNAIEILISNVKKLEKEV